jgi:hypothetical protein
MIIDRKQSCCMVIWQKHLYKLVWDLALYKYNERSSIKSMPSPYEAKDNIYWIV